MDKKVFTMDVLKDSTTSNLLKQKVAFVRLSWNNGIMVSHTTGYVTVAQDVKKGDKFEIEASANSKIKETESTSEITLREGTPEEESVTPIWLSIVQ